MSDSGVFSDLRSFINEIGAAIDSVASSRGKWLTDELVKERIRELSFAWHSNLLPYLGEYSTSVKVSKTLESVAKNTGKRLYKKKFTAPLRECIKLLNSLQIDLGKNPPAVISKKVSSRPLFEEISDVPSEFFPKDLIGWQENIKTFLSEHPFDQNIFIMVRYTEKSKNLIQAVCKTIESFGDGEKKFFPVVANEHQLVDSLNNPIACLLCCRYGIAIFDSAPDKAEINPNVAYEVGFMHLLQRRCLLLKEKKLKSLHTDILHKLYQPYGHKNDARKKVQTWLKELVKK